MENLLKFEKFREKYKEFWYNSYLSIEDEKAIYLEYEFEIPKLTKFHAKIIIDKKEFNFKSINTETAQNIIFNIGLIELISYWKCTCSPKVVIKCGYLDEEQKKWWKKLYFYGLGELFYRNEIKTDIQSFMEIECTHKKSEFNYNTSLDDYSGYIVPIGGGKDSVVTLEVLKQNKQEYYGLIINPKPVTLKCAEIAGLEDNSIIEVHRKIDKNLIDLNEKEYINGHTPFSAMLAFVSYLVAHLLSKKYIALSNEVSSNEANVMGEKINHQYSKSYEFECDFENYANKYLKVPVKYFSFLRPLNELQIAKVFSKYEKYHQTFKSCNVGSKEKEWKWCCKCAKCLFAFTILSPYLYKEKLVSIFGTDMFENKELLNIFLELSGKSKTKPFDCVGTFEEVNFAISRTIQNLERAGQKLPYLLQYYKNHYKLVDITNDITKRYNEENNLTNKQNEMLRKEVFSGD